MAVLVSWTPGDGDTVIGKVSVPVAAGEIVPAMVMVTLAPAARLRPVHSPVAAL